MLKGVKKATQNIIINNKYKLKYKYIKGYPSRGTPLNTQPNAIFINESGLYQLLSNSTKPAASKFRDELFEKQAFINYKQKII